MILASFLGIDSHNSYGEDRQISFKKLTVEDGLSQNSIISIAQDSLGVMWFATQDGLNRYDGLNFEKFDEYFDDVTKPNYSRLGKVFIDQKDNIWLITKSGRLKRYASHNFAVIEIESTQNVNCIYQDHKGQLIAGTWNNGMHTIHPESGISKRLTHFDNQFSKDTINAIIQDQLYRYWIATSSGLFYTDDLETSLTKIEIESLPEHTSISTLSIDQNGRIWIASYKNGLFYKDVENDVIEPFLPLNTEMESSVVGEYNILSLYVDHKNRLWVGTYGDGLFLISEGSVQNFILQKTNPNSISYNDILCVFEDSNGVIWAGTDGGGVSFYDENLHKFYAHTNSDVPEDIHVDVIRAILVDSRDQVWLGTSGYGLTIFDQNGSEKWRTINTNNSALNGDRIMSLTEDHVGNIWIGTQGKGLSVYDIKNQHFDNFYHSKKSAYLPNQTIWAVLHDSQNRHWIGTRDHGLYLFDEKRGIIKQYSPTNSDISGKSIRVIIEENENTIWIGTENSGITRLKINEEEFTSYRSGSKDKNSISSDRIKSLYYQDEFLWIGTSGGGLNVLNIEQGVFQVFTSENGLPNNVIYAIQPDDKNNLWLSTNRGISKFAPPENPIKSENNIEIVNYDNYDGLQGLEFNTGAFYKDRKGFLYFGGINGYNWFHPNDIVINENSSKAIIDNFEVNGVTMLLDTIISRKKIIELKYKENAISFSFSTLNFSMPFRNTYMYKLEGYDEEWISSGVRNYVSYTNLEPGTYSFGVIGGNYDGVFYDQPTELQIIIYPPWWRTIWAYAIGLIILILSAISIYTFQLNRWKLQTQLQLEHQEAERLLELDLFKSRIYTNITHEFRTPLTVILGLIAKGQDYFSSRDIKKFSNIIDIVQQNAHRLLSLVNQMLDLSRLESKSIQLNMINSDVVSFLKNLVGMFDSHAENHNLSLTFKSRIRELHMDYDPDNLQKIVSNILSNSIKFTDSGSVKVSVDEKIINDKRHVFIRIKDTGIGIAEEDLLSIFDRFFQAENSNKKSIIGSGIGMALVKELVELMGGQVDIKSQLGIGTEVEFALPVSNKVKPVYQPVRIMALDSFESYELQLEPDTATQDAKPIILAIEDNKDVLYYLNTCLQDNYQIINAMDGEEGISKALEFVPDIIISDVLMPGKNGYEVCEILKQDTRTSHIPIILLTAKAEIQDKISGLKHGADAYLIKPFNVEELLVQVENLIRTREILIDKFGKFEISASHSPLYPEKENEFLSNLNNFIVLELSNPDLNVDKVCEELLMSRTQLHRKIKALTDKSITSYIRSFRLQKAKELILNSKLTMQQIAFEAGFNDSSYFHKSFVKEYGKKPTDFRN